MSKQMASDTTGKASCDLEIAERQLVEKRLTLCVVKEKQVILESKSKGVSGFVEALETLREKLVGASVADKVVGKAIALLCVHAKVRAVFATTLSQTAKMFLDANAVYLEWDILVDNILGADNVTTCPFERLVQEITDPSEAYTRLKTACFSTRPFKAMKMKNA